MKLLLYPLYRVFLFVMNELCQISNLPLTGVNKVVLIQFLCFLCESSMLTFQPFSDLDNANAVKKRIKETQFGRGKKIYACSSSENKRGFPHRLKFSETFFFKYIFK